RAVRRLPPPCGSAGTRARAGVRESAAGFPFAGGVASMTGRALTTRTMWPAAIAAVIALLTAAPAHAAGAAITFNPFAHEFPEGIALDHQGNTFVSLSPRGEIREIAADGSQSTVATLSP